MEVQLYIEQLEGPRKPEFLQLRTVIVENLPKGFEETIGYGMIGYVVPHSIYPEGYHCTPKLPLPFINIVMRKDIITLYHMGLYSDEKLLSWFKDEYSKLTSLKLDMGKSCIRFKKSGDIPFSLIVALIQKVSVNEWITRYEDKYKKVT
jgi:hypothetical protein